MAATVIHYRPRSAIREVGKALGLTEDVTARSPAPSGAAGAAMGPNERVSEAGLDPDNPMKSPGSTISCRADGVSRAILSQHVGGFVLTAGAADETVPIGNAAMETAPSSNGTRTISTRWADEGRCAGARHADLHPQGFD
jgi:error-prone DNA polymerase